MARPYSHNQLQRRKPTRETFDRVLIVCEGKKTEPLYFRALVDLLRLSTANVEVIGHGADPRGLVKRAKELEKQERRYGERFDVVYCVFDHDEHAHFETASNSAQAAGLKLARSWPCFEYWLVLHFVYLRRPYGKAGGRTRSQNCVRDLKRHLRDYTKGSAGVYRTLEGRLESAKRNAKRALADAEKTGRPDPSTEVHCLVAYLQSLDSRG